MTTNIWSGFLGRLRATLQRSLTSRKSRKGLPRRRLALELLEDRAVPATFHVSLSGNDGTGDGSIGNPFRTVQASIDAAAATADGDDIINVEAGTYSEAGVDLGLSIPSTANLQNLKLFGGYDAGSNFTTRTPRSTIYIPQTPGDRNLQDVNVADANVTIDGFYFVFDGNGVGGTGGTRQSGGVLSTTTGFVFNDNTIEVGLGRTAGGARSIGLGTTATDQTGLTITNNTIQADGGTGALFNDFAHGIFLNPDPVRTTDAIISGNTITGTTLANGIVVDTNGHVNITGNTILRTGTGDAFNLALIGLRARSVASTLDDVTISGNTLDSAGRANSIAIHFADAGGTQAISGVLVEKNLIQNNTLGIVIGQFVNQNNAISATIRYNSFTGNTTALFRSTLAAGSTAIDASRNWWGHISGPTNMANPGGLGQAINDTTGITFRPWLVYSPDSNLALPGVQLPTTVTITAGNDVSAAENDFILLQNAVGAVAEGQTLNLSGDFDWRLATATNAAAAYQASVAGSTTGTVRGIELPGGVDDVTITSSASDAHIFGRGDYEDLILDAFLYTEDGPALGNDNFTLEKLNIDDFEAGVVFGWNDFDRGIFNGTKVRNNIVTLGGDDFGSQNIAFYFAPGIDQELTGNTVNFQGNGTRAVGSGARSFGFQNSTTGGTGYDGLLIDDNTFQVLGTSNGVENVYGIWDNGHNDDDNSDISITNNRFLGRAGDVFDRALVLSSQTSNLLIDSNTFTDVDNVFYIDDFAGPSAGDEFSFSNNVLTRVGGSDGVFLRNVSLGGVHVGINWNINNTIDGETGVRGLNELSTQATHASRLLTAATDINAVNAVGVVVDTFVNDDWGAAGRFTDPDGIGTGYAGVAFGFNTFDTIQEGIDAASAGATVGVLAGTYDLSAGVTIDKHLTLLGAKQGVAGTNASRGTGESVLNGPASQTPGAFTFNTPGPVTLNGFTFNGSHIASGQPAGIDLRFLNNVFNLQAMATGNSMILSNPQRLTLTNNKFTTTGSNLNGSGVIQVEGNYAGTGTANFMDVTGNTFLGVPDANNRRTLQLTFNNVQGNVQDNVFDGVDIGVLVAGTSGNLTISGNTFRNITRGAAQIAAGSFGAGVVFYNPTLSGPVTLSNNTFQNSDAGFRTSTDGSGTFTLNSPTVGITGNTFTGNVFNIVDKFAGTLTLDGNNVFDGVTLSSATTAQLFAIEDKIVDAIDVSGYGLVRLKAGNIYVTPNSFFAPGGTTTPSIQRGIDAANAGDTVNVAAGTYPESVTVNKSLTVLGAQAGLNPTGRTNPALESIVSAPSGTNGFSIGASNVTIRGFTVTTAGGGVYGIAETTPVTGTVIDRNFVNGFDGLGIALAAGSSGAEVTENDVSDNYAGIYLSTGASNVIVRANVVHDHTGTGFDAGSGIVFEGNNTNVLVSQNFIRDNSGSGIYVWSGYGDNFSGTQITSNSITDNDGPGFNDTNAGATDFDAAGNWWGTHIAAGVAAEIVGNVDFTPFLFTGEDTDPFMAGFQGNPLQLGVSISGSELIISGTDAADRISISRFGPKGLLVTSLIDGQFESTPYFLTGGFTVIRINLHGGDDRVSIDPRLVLPVHVVGGAGNDTINTVGGKDVIYGDAIDGSGDGNDTIVTGSGDDFVNAGNGTNYVNVGAGNNTVRGGSGGDRVLAGSGNNDIRVGDGENDVRAGSGRNTIVVGNGANFILTGNGANSITAGNGANSIRTGLGIDTIVVGDGANFIQAGHGRNIITAGNGVNYIITGVNADRIRAGNGSNWVSSSGGNDNIVLGDGGSTVLAGDGADVVVTGAGSDTIFGGAGADLLLAGAGNDIVRGGLGNDVLVGGQGSDYVAGEDGRDVLFAGAVDLLVPAPGPVAPLDQLLNQLRMLLMAWNPAQGPLPTARPILSSFGLVQVVEPPTFDQILGGAQADALFPDDIGLDQSIQ